MVSVDTVYKVLLTIINKEQNGYITPEEFNLLANNVQQEIFRGYFEDDNLDRNKFNRGLTNGGYSNLPMNQRQKITIFAAEDDIVGAASGNASVFTLPTDLYLLEQDGISTTTGKIVSESERKDLARAMSTEVAPTATYPEYEQYGSTIKVYPNTILNLNVRYLRKPLQPRWTYTIVGGKELYDPSNGSFQDFELHPSEFSNIVLKMLSFFGINLREEAVVQVAEALMNRLNKKEDN